MPNTVRRPNLFASRRPMSEMNVTPFIDVLLVLIIMLIMVVPIATHKTEVDLPAPCQGCFSNPDGNTVSIDASDQLFWNGSAVTADELKAHVGFASNLPEEPLLRFEPNALSSYDRSARTIALIKDAGAEKFAFVGNHQHKDFER